MKRKVQNKTEGLVKNCSIPTVGGSFPSREWLMDVIDEVVDNNQTLDSENIADSIIEQWEKENESIEKLEVGKDYVHINNNKFIVIDRKGEINNNGFINGVYYNALICFNTKVWREATEAEVIESFRKHLVCRYGKDWETMKIQERHPDSGSTINNGSWEVEISKYRSGWCVWNKNGVLYRNGIWVERLEEPENKKNVKNEKLSSDYYGLDWEKIHIKEAIKERTVIHCETEEEANRILRMAHGFGYKWASHRSYVDGANNWDVHESETCYYLFDGLFANSKYFNYENFVIIPSTQITDVEEKKSTDWTTPPKDFEYKKIKISSNLNKKRYEVIKTTFLDFKQISIGDSKTNKIIAHFVNQDEDTPLLAEKIVGILNLMEK